jgi:hypothetical protein
MMGPVLGNLYAQLLGRMLTTFQTASLAASQLVQTQVLNATTSNAATPGHNAGAFRGVSVSSVDLIAMIVSDSGLQNAEPQWWNASPLGCILIGVQPRGGWQVIQRCVQWGTDFWASCFGVKCEMNLVYQYFSCSMRNRLEVWDSDQFFSPMHGNPELEDKPEDSSGSALEKELDKTRSLPVTSKKSSKPVHSSKGWKQFYTAPSRRFEVSRPTKLVDGSRGGQAFICDVLLPAQGKSYGIDDQARMQFLSIVLVAVSLMKDTGSEHWRGVLGCDFQLNDQLGVIFRRLHLTLLIVNIVLLASIVSICYSLWVWDIYRPVTPYAVQICSLFSWGFGAMGLLMNGGNPRVKVAPESIIPERFEARLEANTDLAMGTTKDEQYVKLNFGSLHGSIFTPDCGSCTLPLHVVYEICVWHLKLVRTKKWFVSVAWYLMFLGISIVLQIAGSVISTLSSEIMGVIFLIATAILRGQGLSGSEKRMIPRWKMRKGSGYAVRLLGQMQSRRGIQEVA